ncbi:DUF917 domain-containing protein [Gandjariella thermophila]|uniref:Hydantoinase n=1 Tax=Gandjariella thermophila TaxID=1931992 RepID=A0A4D4JD17_9PSEU|nr:DUF917 domain-containing protein [Gandjariella thermophila]GDY32269.1 hypothetical protein GTS_39020 [Gandjariella thermophila]
MSGAAESTAESFVDRLAGDDVEALERGASLLGSGGGGHPRLGALWLNRELAGGAEVRVVGVDSLTGWVLPVAAAGSTASVAVEKLSAGDELRRCVEVAEQHLGIEVDTIGVLAIGGGNALFPFIAAAQTGKPVPDADLTGRAFSGLEQTVVGCGPEFTGTWVSAEAHGAAMVIDGAGPPAAERVMRGALAGLGGWAALAYPPLPADTFRRLALAGTVSHALRLGHQHRQAAQAAEDGATLARRLGGEHLGRGTVLEVHRGSGGKYAGGSVAMRSPDGDGLFRVEMGDEYTMVLRDGEVVATTPDVICLLDTHRRQVIPTGQVRRGHEVDILLLPVPDRLWHADVLPRLAPRAYGLDADPVRYRAGGPVPAPGGGS